MEREKGRIHGLKEEAYKKRFLKRKKSRPYVCRRLVPISGAIYHFISMTFRVSAFPPDTSLTMYVPLENPAAFHVTE